MWVPPSGRSLSTYVPVPTRRPLLAQLRSRIMRPSSASTTSNSAGSDMPPALAVTVARAPTPVAGPEQCQSTSMWSVKDSWLAITSRNAKTSARGWGTSMETETGADMMYHMVHLGGAESQAPGAAARGGHRPHRHARRLGPQPARARGGDRLQPPH